MSLRPVPVRTDDKSGLQVRPAAAGEDWYTWRSALRKFTPAPGRRVFNAYREDQLQGSVLVAAREAGPMDPQTSAWDFADSNDAFHGPYFNADDCVPEPVYLHFESMYVRESARRTGVGRALMAAVADVGLPTYCQFAAEFLVPVFEGWDADLDDDERWTNTCDRPGGALAAHLELALDGDARPQRLKSGRFSVTVRAQLHPGVAPPHVRSVDAPAGDMRETKVHVEEGTRESDVCDADEAWVWDDDLAEYALDSAQESLDFQLSQDRSGIEVRRVDRRVLHELEIGSEDPALIEWGIEGEVLDPGLLEARSSWRRFLATFDDEWEPRDLGAAIAELARDDIVTVESSTEQTARRRRSGS